VFIILLIAIFNVPVYLKTKNKQTNHKRKNFHTNI